MPNPAVAPGDQDHGAILGDNAVAAAKAARGGGVGAMASALKKTMGEEAFAKNQPAVVAFLNQQFDPTQVHRAINPGTASSLWTRTLNALPGVSPNDAEITLSQMRNAQGGQQPGLIRGMNTAAPYTPNLLWGPFAPAELLIRNAMGGN